MFKWLKSLFDEPEEPRDMSIYQRIADQVAQSQLENEQERLECNKRILEVWQALDSIKLKCVLFFWSSGGREELFLDNDNLVALKNLYDANVNVCVYTRRRGPILLRLRSDAVLKVAIQPDDYVLFEGAVAFVPEEQE